MQIDDSEDPLGKLYTDHYTGVYVFFLHKTHCTYLAEDLTHDTILRAYQKRGQYTGKGSLRNWLLTIARNLLNDYHRRKNMDRNYTETCRREENMGYPINPAPHIGIKELRFEISRLPEQLREPLVRTALRNMSYRDAADSLGISLPSLRMRVHKARNLLARNIKKNHIFVSE